MREYEISKIKSREDCNRALQEMTRLMEIDPEPGSKDFKKMETLAVLIEVYEKEHVHIDLPDPIDAIKYRMNEKNWKNRDLVPYLGSPAKVSEVLNRKRTMTFEMMQKLSEALAIPAEVFFNYHPQKKFEGKKALLSKVPIRELIRKGWINTVNAKDQMEKVIDDFFSNQIYYDFAFESASDVCKRQHIRRGSNVDEIALATWEYMALKLAAEKEISGKYECRRISSERLQKLVALSVLRDGPKRAQAMLADWGIRLVILPHLTKTHIDGAAMRIPESNEPVIALTLRYDRIDNFWFCLFHELGHVLKHLDEETLSIAEDLVKIDLEDRKEQEADRFANDHLIPAEKWRAFDVAGDYSPTAVNTLAQEIGIHPAIVAGRIRFQTHQWKILSRMVGFHEVRIAFGSEYANFA